MGTISDKLTYLNDTKQLLKENINNLGGNLTTEPFRQYASVLEGIYESLPKVSGIGASLSLSPSMVGKIKLNEIQGNTLQDGTPTPSSPVPIQSVTGLQKVNVCGKNIWCFKDSDLYSLEADSYTILGNNSVQVTASSGTWKSVKFKFNAPDGTYTFSVGKVINSNSNVTTQRITLSSVINNTRTVIKHINMGTPETITIQNETGKQYEIEFWATHSTSLSNTATYEEVQVVKGSTATTYEPYTGNTYEVNLGKNLLPNLVTTQTKNGVEITKNSDGSLTFNNTATAGINLNINYASGSYIHLESGKKYTISITNNSGIYFRLAKVSDGTLVASFDTPTKQTTFTSSYTGDVFAYLTILNGTSFSNLTIYPQIKVGSQATSYSPYFTPYELNKIGDYEDKIYKDSGKWYLEKNIQNWSTDSPNVFLINGSDGDAQSSPDGLFQIFTSNLFTNFRNETMLSSKFKYHYDSRINNNINANTYLTDNTFCIRQGTNDRVYFKSSDLANKSKTDVLSTLNSLDLSYVLSTPTYTVITNTELINQLESLNNAKSEDGTTNINVTSEDLSMLLNVGVLKGE